MSRPSRVPSKQLVKSTTAGALIGAALEIAAAAAGFPLPDGTGAAIAAAITAATHYIQKHGRKPAPEPPPEIP